jgi:hypothetical protein
MPLPIPNNGESKDDFMGRCISNENVRADFDSQEQRAAVCNRLWDGAQAQAADGKAADLEDSNAGRELATKSVGTMEFTDDEKGEVRAIVYTLGVVDRDREVILPETFQGEAKVLLSEYGHSSILSHSKGSGNPVKAPVGKGILRKNAANELEFVGKYNMRTTRGRDAYFTAKDMGPDQEWSVTFWRDKGEPANGEWASKGARRVWRTPIEPFEVSPVTVAGGIGTRTVGVKAADVAPGPDNSEEAVKQAVKEAVKEVSDEEKAKADEDAEAQRLADEAAQIAADAEAKRKVKEDEAKVKQMTDEAMEEYHRVQRTLKHLGVIG